MGLLMSFCLGIHMHLLVSFIFYDMTSLHPPLFHRNDYFTCYIFGENVGPERC